MTCRTMALAACLALAGGAPIADAQDAARGAAIPLAEAPPPQARARAGDAPPPARVEIVLGDVEVKLRSVRVVLTLDPDRAAALAGALSDATVQVGRSDE